MTPQAFVHKWRDNQLKERSFYQEHFLDLCHLIGHATPAETDKTGATFTFEAGAGRGFATQLRQLFAVLSTGGWFGEHEILHFDGGLFDNDRDVDIAALELDSDGMASFTALPAWTGAASNPRFWGRCLNAASTPANAPNSARTTPAGRIFC